jgi:hypothetical protein
MKNISNKDVVLAINLTEKAIRKLIFLIENNKETDYYDIHLLKRLLICFQDILKNLQSGDIPSENFRPTWIARMISDSWPFNTELGNLLAEAEYTYKEL